MDINMQTEILKRSSLFKDFPDYTVKNLAANAKILSLPQETNLYHQGDAADALYLIGTGSVTLYKKTTAGDEVQLGMHQAGEYFGEIDFFNETGKRAVTAKAAAKTVLFRIPREVFMFLLEQNNTLALELVKHLSVRLNAAYQQLTNNVNNRPNELADYLKLEITPETDEEPTDINEMLYDRKLVCPHCQAKFTTPRVLTKYIVIEKTDNDFCNYYKGLNPIFYDVAVCPNCGFAFTDESREPLGPNAVTGVKKLLVTLPQKDYCIIRNINLAKEAFALAIKTQTAAGGKHSLIAKLYLRLAWLHRYQGDSANEQKFIEQSVKYYESAFSRENFNPKQEIMLLYLMGELFYRLGDPKMAINWFNRTVTHPQKHIFMGIVNRARDRWQEIRADMKK